MDDDIKRIVLKHLAYCRGNNWAGIEPYDALNSRVLAAMPFLDSRIPRLILTQTLKRSPINIRPLLLIGNTQNPKAIAVFLSSFLNLSKVKLTGDDDINAMIERLVALRSKDTPYWCWGYSFPWQTRKILVPRWAPNLVCTYFAASALLDVYEARGDSNCMNMAVSAAEYMLNELFWTDAASDVGFSYPLPGLRGHTHNANFLAAALLCRVYKHTGEKKFLAPALKVARYTAAQQHTDGSWDYGEAPTQLWNDNFHTGFNLCALRSIDRDLGTTEFEPCLRRGFEFYRAHFFREDGAVRYYHDRTYPIDTHCVAQSIITLLVLRDLDSSNTSLARSVFRWAIEHMWDERGFFYYRVLRSCTIRTSYMRWTQSWMLLAMSMMLEETGRSTHSEGYQRKPDLAEVSSV